jgi:hypothetical protein
MSNPWIAALLAGCAVWVGASVVAVVGLVVAARRAEKAECRRRHPSGQSVASYLVAEQDAVERGFLEVMPPHFAAWLRAEIAAEVARREAQVLADDDAVFAVVEQWRRGDG